MKKRSKIRKIALWTFIVLLALLATVLALIQSPRFQTYVVHRISQNLSDDLGTEVSVGSVDIAFPNFAVLKNVLVRDQSSDTLFYIDELRASFRDLDREHHLIKFGKIELSDPKVYLKIEEGKTDMNLQFLVDKFTPDTPDPNAPTWIAMSDQIVLKNGSFIFYDENLEEPDSRDFKENNIRINQINTDLRDFVLVEDSLDFTVKRLAAREYCGLAIKNMHSRTKISSSGMDFENLELHTDNSELRDRIVFEYESYRDFGEFIDSVNIDGHLEDALVSVKDLAYFSDELKSYEDEYLVVSSLFKGTVAHFDANDVALNFAEKGSFNGDVTITGMPDYETSLYEFKIDRLVFDGTDIQKSYGISGIPDEVRRLGTCAFSGGFKGYYNDFVAHGILRSEAGIVDTDLEFKRKENAPERYAGTIEATDVDLGRIMDDDNLGTTSFSFTLKEGEGMTASDFNAVFDGTIHHVIVGGYNYTNIGVDGKYDGKRFVGDASIDDRNAKIKFNGRIDLNTKVPYYNFFADIDHMDLEALGYQDLPTELSGTIGCELTGAKLNDMEGTVKLGDIHVIREGRSVQLDAVEIFASKTDTSRDVSLYSDVADIQIKGAFDFDNLNEVADAFVRDLFPDYYPSREDLEKPVVIDFRLRVNPSQFIATLLDSQFAVGPSVFIGKYSSREKSLTADARISSITFDKYHLDKVNLNVQKEPDELLFMSSDIAMVREGPGKVTDNVVLNATVLPNQVDFMFNFADTTSDVALRSYGLASFTTDSIQLAFEESRAFIQGRWWVINSGNNLLYTNERLFVEKLFVSNANQEIRIDGIAGKDFDDEIDINLHQFGLSNLNPFLVAEDITLAGQTSGELAIHRVMASPVVHGQLNANDLVFNGDTLGDVKVRTVSAPSDPMLLTVEGSVVRGILKDIQVNGKINLNPNVQTMALKLSVNHGSVKPFEPFMGGEVTDLEGTASADVRVSGKIDAPDLNGTIHLHKVGMTMDYFKTRYVVSGPVKLNRTAIQLQNDSIIDERGNIGKINGVVRHKNFDDFTLDVKVTELKDFFAMNTTRKDNDYFYGTAVADGRVEVSGPIDDVYLKVVAKSKPGTQINIPLETENTNTSASYIQFVDFDKDPEDITEVRQKVEGFTMDLEFEVTPEAKIALIFDEATDDIITGRGSGNIRMEVNSYGDFYMFGDYVIAEGSYPYKAYFISEEFKFKKGGRISWDGNPYDATIDMEASVRKTANPGDLFTSTEVQQSYKPIPVDCQLFLEGKLFSPEIKFGLDFPNIPSTGVPSQFRARISQISENPDELNRQFFAVLALGSFIPPAGAASGIEVGGVGTQSLSNGVSSILNKYIGNLLASTGTEVDVNWNPTPEERDQVRVEVRQKLLDDKLELVGSGDAAAQSFSSNPIQFKAIYDLTPDGRVKVQAFYQRANDLSLGGVNNTTSQAGVGFFIRREMDQLRLKKKKDPVDLDPNQ